MCLVKCSLVLSTLLSMLYIWWLMWVVLRLLCVLVAGAINFC